MVSTTVNEEEVARFSAQAGQWWNPNGPFRALHDMQGLRMGYIEDILKKQAGRSFQELAVLDVGCGGGLLAEPLAALGTRVTGIDASEKAIDVARGHAQASGLEIDYQVTTAEELARTQARFDVITAFEIVEHVANLKTFMKALSALLKPEGTILIATMNRTKRSFLLGVVAAEYVLGWVPPGTHDWDRFVRPSEMAALWDSLGIQATDVTGVAYSPLARCFGISKGKTAVNYFMAGQKSKNAS